MKIFDLIRSDFERLKSETRRSTFAVITSRMCIAVVFVRLNTSENLVNRVIGKLALQWIFSIEVASRAKIGAALLLPHPKNIILGCAEMGANCTIMQGATLGASKLDFGFDTSKRPLIGDGCFLGVNTVVLGGGQMASETIVKPNTFMLLK